MIDPWDEDNKDKVVDLGHLQMNNRSRCKLSKNYDEFDVDKVIKIFVHLCKFEPVLPQAEQQCIHFLRGKSLMLHILERPGKGALLRGRKLSTWHDSKP